MAEITFTDVLIAPKYSEVMSRSQVDISSDFGAFKLSLPVISANMKQITGSKMAYTLWQYGGLGILHRFNSDEDAVSDFNKTIHLITQHSYNQEFLKDEIPADIRYRVGVSIGVKDYDKERFNTLYKAGARVFCIDIAHGHHLLMKNMIHWIRNESIQTGDVLIMAGNVATHDGALALHEWGADIIKVGIGPGAVCETRKNTGVGVPQLFALQDIRENSQKLGLNLKIVSDGGIKTSGDIAKAMKYADAVMVGSFISGTSETPGDVFEDPKGQFYKVYGGSASAENKVSSGREHQFVEGVMTTVPFRGHVKYIFRRVRENLQSAFSYVGATNLKEFQEKAEFRFISGGGKSESKI